jgi:AraC-like DNA-binding protein
VPIALQIRKQALAVLHEYVLPQLQEGRVNQLLLQPPYDLKQGEFRVLQEALLPNNPLDPLNVVVDWSETNVAVRRMSQLSYIYSGASQERVGVTSQIAQNLQAAAPPPGLIEFELKAPVAFYVPPLLPHGGNYLLNEANPRFGILVLNFTREEFLLRVFDTSLDTMHVLRVRDEELKKMEHVYHEMLRMGAYGVASSYLLNMMLRLRDGLQQGWGSVINTAWPIVSGDTIPLLAQASPRSTQLCRRVIHYILFHLDKSLTLEALARLCGVTPQHLSQVFVKSTGINLMNYVTQLRLNSAERMLVFTDERVSDIAKLCGFASPSSFSAVFKRSYGAGPREYRQQKREKS